MFGYSSGECEEMTLSSCSSCLWESREVYGLAVLFISSYYFRRVD